MGRGRKIELPQNLVDAVREQRAILFLGSGASLGAVNRSGAPMPGATDLAKAIATKFLTPKSAKDGLMVVAELAASEAGSSAFNQWLADTFEFVRADGRASKATDFPMEGYRDHEL